MADKFKAVTFKFPVDIVKKYTEKSGDRVIEGYCVTNDLDLAGDVITDDAMKGAEKDLETNSTVLYNHDLDRPIGKVVKSKLDKKGLYIKIVISKSEDCEPIWEKVEEEIINKFSVRLRVLEKKEEFVAAVKRTVNFIKKMMLLEVSLVTVPMNPEAKSIGWYIAKSLEIAEIADNGGEVEMKENKEAKKATEKVVEEKKEIDVAAATEKVDEKVEEKKEEVVVEAKPEEKVEEKVEEKKEEVVVEAKPEEKVEEKKEEVVPVVEKTEEVVEEKVEVKPEEKAEEVVVEKPVEAAPEATKTEAKPEEKKEEPKTEVTEEKETTSKSAELIIDILKKSLKTTANEDERKTITDVIETLEPKKVEEKVVEKKIEEKETTVEDEKKSMTDILKEMREETKTRLDKIEESFSPASIKGIVEDVISEIPGINGTRKGVTVDTEADKIKSNEEAQKLYDALPLDVRMKAAITLQEEKNK